MAAAAVVDSMSLDVVAAIQDALARLPTRVGAVLAGLYLLVAALSTVAAQTLALAVARAMQRLAPAATPPTVTAELGPPVGGDGVLALDLGLPLATALFLVQVVLAQAVGVVAVRTFVADASRSFPRGLSHRLVWVVLNALVASFAVTVLIGLGLVLLVVPGVYLAVALYFVEFEVIVEERHAFDALRSGWALTRGDRLEVFVLFLLVFAVGLASGAPGVVLGRLGAPAAAVTAVSVALGAVAGVFSIAVGARAYVQLKPAEWSPPAGTPSPFAR
jgi:hypothetical protein